MRPLLLLAALVLAAGCADNRGNQWPAVKPGAGKLGVVFAPVAVGSLTAVYPQAPVELAQGLAWRVDFFDGRHGFDGLVAEGLAPGGDTAAACAALGDRDVLVVAEVTDQERIHHVDGDHRSASALLTAYDRNGRPRGSVRGRGEVLDSNGPKLMAPALRSESQAAKAALTDASDRLLPVLLVAGAPVADPIPAPAKVQIAIASSPDHGDVLIDGRFVGNTPLTLGLPPVECTIRIERQGCQPWERRVTPAPGMEVAPVLLPVAGVPAP